MYLIYNFFALRQYIRELPEFANTIKAVHIHTEIDGRHSWKLDSTVPYRANIRFISTKYVSTYSNIIFYTVPYLLLYFYWDYTRFVVYFSEGTSDIMNTALTGIVDPIVYGVFNTPVNAISGSAVCMFNISNVIETFMGSFKDQEAMDSNWLPVKKVRLSVIEDS